MANENNIEKTEETEKLKGRSRKLPGGRKRAAWIAGIAVVVILAAAGGIYAGLGQKYKTVFFPGTLINEMDVSGLTVEQVKELIASGIDGYTLTIQGRGDFEAQISGEDILLHPEFDGTLEQIVAGQNPLEWGMRYDKSDSYWIEAMMAYDKDKLTEEVSGLTCLNDDWMEAPKDAYMSEYISGTGYQIVPEDQGRKADAEKVLKAVSDAILGLKDRLDLEDHDVYEKPQITSDDPELQARTESWNRYVDARVTYRFGSRSEVLDGDTIHTWLADDGQGGPQLDEAKVSEYVAGLAKTYNTAYKPKQLKTSYGATVTISGGNYGWRINQSAETAALVQILRSGESQEREPVYSQTAASHDGNDYGNTYVEINLTAQHLYFYKNGNLVTQSDFVSGNESKGWSTPAGAYPLTYKQRNATLKGEGYATPVNYWMPFNGGIGMHDANWRGSFGGSIYKTSGSHGCINLPPSIAKTIYESISSGIPVLCYHLEGTGKGSSTPAPTETTAPAETTAPQAETTAPQTETTVSATETLPEETTRAEIQASTEAQGPGPGETQPVTEDNAATGVAPGNPAQLETTAQPQVQESPGPAEATTSYNRPDGPGGVPEAGYPDTPYSSNNTSGGPGM